MWYTRYNDPQQSTLEAGLKILKEARIQERKSSLHTAECRRERERWVYDNEPCENCGLTRWKCGGECYE